MQLLYGEYVGLRIPVPCGQAVLRFWQGRGRFYVFEVGNFTGLKDYQFFGSVN